MQNFLNQGGDARSSVNPAMAIESINESRRKTKCSANEVIGQMTSSLNSWMSVAVEEKAELERVEAQLKLRKARIEQDFAENLRLLNLIRARLGYQPWDGHRNQQPQSSDGFTERPVHS